MKDRRCDRGPWTEEHVFGMLGQGRGGVVGEVPSVAHNEACETRKIDLNVA